METTRLYLIRHGQVQGHENLRFNGHTDVDLTDLGRAQLDAVAEDLAQVPLDAVYASDLKRARYGGQKMAERQGLELILEPGLREIFFGGWEGMSFDEIKQAYPGELDLRRHNMLDHQAPGGAETIRGFAVRITNAIHQLIRRHPGQKVALVAHSGVNRIIILEALGADWTMIWRMHQDYGCLNVIDYPAKGHPIVRLANGPNRVTDQPL